MPPSKTSTFLPYRQSYVGSQLLITDLLGNRIKRRSSPSDFLMSKQRGPRADASSIDEFPVGMGWPSSNHPVCLSLPLLPYSLLSSLFRPLPPVPKALFSTLLRNPTHSLESGTFYLGQTGPSIMPGAILLLPGVFLTAPIVHIFHNVY